MGPCSTVGWERRKKKSERTLKKKEKSIFTCEINVGIKKQHYLKANISCILASAFYAAISEKQSVTKKKVE